MPDAFYLRRGELLVPTESTLGPWAVGAQHGGPPSALAARALEHCEPRPDWHIGRVAVEILSPVPLAPLRVEARVTRPGRSVELLEATVRVDGAREVLRAQAWRFRPTGLGADIADPSAGPLPAPQEAVPGDFFPGAPEVGYHTAMDIRFVHGGFDEQGPAQAWFRMRQPLVDAEDPTPLQRVLVAADAGNGISSMLDFRRYVFINTDLTVQLVRPVDGPWVSVDARTLIDGRGVGLAESRIGDGHGRAGRATQTLFVSPREAPLEAG